MRRPVIESVTAQHTSKKGGYSMRKLFIPLMLLVLVLQAVGCGTPAAPTPTEVPPEAAPTEAAPVATPTEAPATPSPELASEQVLRIGINATFNTLDPHKTAITTDHAVIHHIQSGLFRYAPGAELQADLCTDWEVSGDGLVYTFHLREGVQWHKGYGEFTADDVKYSIERVLDPEAQTRFAVEFAGVDEIEVVDDYTLRITLKEPYAPFLHKLAAFRQGFIMNQDAVEEFGDDIARVPIGTGPFIFDHWTPRTEIVLVANPDYYAGPPTLDKLIFVPIPEVATLEMALESGDVDVMEVTDATTYERFLANPDITVKKVPSLMQCSIGFNTKMEPFTDVRVRRALAYAIDKDEIIDYILAGVATRADSPVAPAFFGYTEDVTIYGYDPDRARELLAEAGYADGFETTTYYGATSGYGFFPTAMLAVQEDWADVGVQLNIEVVDGATWMDLCGRHEVPLSYAGITRPPDPDLALTIYHDENGAINFVQYDIQELLEAGRTEQDVDARRAIYEEIQQRLTEDAAMIPLFYPDSVLAMGNYVQGMEVDMMRGYWAYDTSILAH